MSWLTCCLEAASAAIQTEFGTRESRESFLLLLPHVTALEACAAQQVNEVDLLTKLSLIDHKTGYGLHNLGDYARALEYYWRALVIFMNVFGIEHPNAQTILFIMMSAYEKSEHTIPFDEWIKDHMKSYTATS